LSQDQNSKRKYVKKRRRSSWEWYAIKLLFVSIITGEPNTAKIDENFSNDYKVFEERIIVVRAQSSDHAYKLAELEARKDEITYNNPYDQTVQSRFVDALNCQRLIDNEITSGTEVYYRLFKVPIGTETKTFIETHCREALPNEGETASNEGEITPYYNFLINE